MSASMPLDAVPHEVLEQIAFFTATNTFLGPPSGLVPLLLVNRQIYSWLSTQSNHHLYGRIFVNKFDIGAVTRRIGADRTTPQILTRELQRRCFHLKRIRARSDSIIYSLEGVDSGCARAILLDAFFMMLENEGKNEKQLREYAGMDHWLREYWFHEAGASRAVAFLRAEKWLPDTQERSLAMWLFWFLLRPGQLPDILLRCVSKLATGDFRKDDEASSNALNTIKTLALAAHKVSFLQPSSKHLLMPVISMSLRTFRGPISSLNLAGTKLNLSHITQSHIKSVFRPLRLPPFSRF